MNDVVVDLDQYMLFGPLDPDIMPWLVEHRKQSRKVAVEISEELLARYKKAAKEFFAVNELMEHAYRKQEGLHPHLNCPSEFM